jgi:hypothetical protein
VAITWLLHVGSRRQGIAGLSWSVANFAGPLAGGFVIDRTGVSTAGCAVVGTVAMPDSGC